MKHTKENAQYDQFSALLGEAEPELPVRMVEALAGHYEHFAMTQGFHVDMDPYATIEDMDYVGHYEQIAGLLAEAVRLLRTEPVHPKRGTRSQPASRTRTICGDLKRKSTEEQLGTLVLQAIDACRSANSCGDLLLHLGSMEAGINTVTLHVCIAAEENEGRSPAHH